MIATPQQTRTGALTTFAAAITSGAVIAAGWAVFVFAAPFAVLALPVALYTKWSRRVAAAVLPVELSALALRRLAAVCPT